VSLNKTILLALSAAWDIYWQYSKNIAKGKIINEKAVFDIGV